MTTAPPCIPISEHPHLLLRPTAWPTSDPARGLVVEEQPSRVVLKDITLEYKTNRSPRLALDRINLPVKTGEFPLHCRAFGLRQVHSLAFDWRSKTVHVGHGAYRR